MIRSSTGCDRFSALTCENGSTEPLEQVVPPAGLEPAAKRLEGACSIGRSGTQGESNC
jgi:hypothetical protein